MKNLTLFFFLVCSYATHAQNLSGFYSGRLVNESTHREQQYELALTDYKGKITGYSYTTFIVNDTFYYSVKRVKAVKNNHVLEVEDTKMLANNLPQAPDKGVHQVMRIPLDDRDSISSLSGTWQTTQTKKFYTIGGSMDMHRETDSSRLALVHHLYDIGEWQVPLPQAASTVAVAAVQTPPTNKPAAPAKRTEPQVAVKTTTAKPQQETRTVVASESVKTLAYGERKTQLSQQFVTSTDSLVLSFYDNGIVDGDTISVYLNGTNIISKVKLTAAAAKQTIYLSKTAEVNQLVLVAENLGTIPPNTGLLVVQDGNNRYQVHFTADLQNNAMIEFRKARVGNSTTQ